MGGRHLGLREPAAGYPQLNDTHFNVLKGQQEIARGKQRAAPGSEKPVGRAESAGWGGCRGAFRFTGPIAPLQGARFSTHEPGAAQSLAPGYFLPPLWGFNPVLCGFVKTRLK